MDNSPKTESIKHLVENIDKQRTMLPEFQRDFVWEVGKTYDLFDSLIKDIFIGSVIYGIPSFEITAREIDNRKRKTSGTRRRKLNTFDLTREYVEKESKTSGFRLVLDGQQRMTSIYRALKGIDEVWFVSKNDNEVSLSDTNQAELEDLLVEFSGQEDAERLCVKISDAFEIMQHRSKYREKDIETLFFGKLAFLKNKTENEKSAAFNKYLLILDKLQFFLNAEKLLSFYLLDTSAEKFSLFFERSNSKGIQLNFIDILAAKLYVGFNLRKEIDEFEDIHKGYELNREIIVRAISFIVSEGKNVQKSFILSDLNWQHFQIHWKELCLLYKKSVDFLFENNLYCRSLGCRIRIC